MDCEKIRDLFSEYIEHQLEEEDIALFEKHMEKCQQCRNEFYKFEKMIIRLKAIKDIEPPKELKDKIMKKVVSEENKKLNAKIINFRKHASVAAAVLILIVGIIYYQNSLIKSPDLNVHNTDNEMVDNHEGANKARIINSEDEGISAFSPSEEDAGVSAFNSSEKIAEDKFNETEETNQIKGRALENLDINLYNEGIDIDIITDDIQNFMLFLYDNFENIKFYEDNSNYIELVLDKIGFSKLEEEIENIEEYSVYIDNLNKINEEIEQIIENGNITDEGLIKFKITIKETSNETSND